MIVLMVYILASASINGRFINNGQIDLFQMRNSSLKVKPVKVHAGRRDSLSVFAYLDISGYMFAAS